MNLCESVYLDADTIWLFWHYFGNVNSFNKNEWL